MTNEERFKRYIKILDKYGEATSSWNIGILEKLSDDELFDENKILEKINIIQKHQVRIENNPNKYPENIMEYVRQRFGLEKYDDSRDEEINQLSQAEVFAHVCNCNGLLGYVPTIKSWIVDIYNMKLEEC